MDTPKISVIVPMFNRKHYIEQCVGSVLNQTFKDWELIIRDDGSSDGSADFVAQRYAAEISSGKIKLRRNEKNIGEFPTDNRLIPDARGKYLMVLHSDDMYLPHALEHMYTVAEHFKADVVHESVMVTTAPDGIIAQGTPLQLKPYDKRRVDKVTLMSDDLFFRFNTWLYDIGIDAMHNIFNREFFMENDLRFESFGRGRSLTGGNRLLALKWLMRAEVFVKTPQPCYVYRNSPDSITRSKFPPEHVAELIAAQIRLSRHLDEFFAAEDFFRDNAELQYLAHAKLFNAYDSYWIRSRKVYKDGITPELHRAVEGAFKEFFGKDSALPTFLFHWIHAAQFNRPATQIISSPTALSRCTKKSNVTLHPVSAPKCCNGRSREPRFYVFIKKDW